MWLRRECVLAAASLRIYGLAAAGQAVQCAVRIVGRTGVSKQAVVKIKQLLIWTEHAAKEEKSVRVRRLKRCRLCVPDAVFY